MSHKDAKEFANMTRDKKRKKMSNEVFKIWVRRIFKKIIKPEYFTLVCVNFSNVEMTRSNKMKLGVMFEEIIQITDGPRRVYDVDNDQHVPVAVASKCDEVIRKQFPSLLRNGSLIINEIVKTPQLTVYLIFNLI